MLLQYLNEHQTSLKLELKLLQQEVQMSNIILRPLKMSDSDFLLELVNNPEVTKYLPGLIHNKQMLLSWIKSLDDSSHEYIIQLEKSGTDIGECSINRVGKVLEIGLMLLPQYWNRGYGTETVRSLLDIAKSSKMKNITAVTDNRNSVMIRILENLGFILKNEGWMWKISEDEQDRLNEGQNIVVYEKVIAPEQVSSNTKREKYEE